MTDETRIYLELSKELQQALDDNGITPDEILRKAEIDAKVKHDRLPVQSKKGGKDLAQVIEFAWAGSAVIASLGFTLTKILNTIYNKPIYVEYEELEELRDAGGNVLLDAKGEPVYKKVPRRQILQAQQTSKDSFMADMKKMVMKFSSEGKRA
ncbi:MAG: hypothetical protein GY862_03520 [Gammaproteobacteria bacterium]|nr:hypothetical protein [Gammaproteobacteria bacterium]